MTTALLAPTLAVFLAGPSPVLAYTTSDIATKAETYVDGTHGKECKQFVGDVVKDVTGTYPGGYQQGFAAGAIEIANPANAVRGDIIQITPAGSIDSTAEGLRDLTGTDSARRLHTAIIRAPRLSDGKFSVIDSNFNNDLDVLRHNFDPYSWASGSIIKIWRYAGNGTPPGGWWLGPTPNDGTTLSPSPAPAYISVNVHGEAGSSALERIDITWEAEGTNQWSKQTQWLNTNASVVRSDFAYNIPKPASGWPTSLIISFDVYGTDGRVHYAPQGMRRICIANVSCASTAAVPVSGGVNNQVGGGSSGGSQTNCTPGQYQAAVFTEPNYGGNCVVKGIGEYSNPESIGLPNDSVSSIKVGSGANVRLCENAGMTSPCFYYSANDDRLGYFDSLGDNTLSSMKVEGGGPTTNCQPGEREVAFFANENYQETCTIRGVGRYNDASALGLPNDTISSVKVGARVWVRICDNINNDSPCDQFESDRADLTATTVQNNRASSAEVFLKGGIALCDNDLSDNNGGECKYFGAGDTGENLQNMSSHNFDNRAESVRYDPDWEGRYHIVLYVDQNQTGALAHYDGSVNSLQPPYRNSISSIKIYKNHPPNARALAPASGTIFPATTTSVTLNYTEGQERRVHVWNSSGYDFTSEWAPSETHTLTNLAPGTYSWQAQSRSPIIGEGAWSAVQAFSINTPPAVTGGSLTMDAGTSQTIQVQAMDAEGSPITLTASGLPAFTTFTDNGGGTGTLQLNPTTSQNGQYNITVTANDGSTTGTGNIAITVNSVAPPPPTGYQAQYFNNRTLTGSPILTRDEAAINNDWGGGSPGSSVNADNFSACWIKSPSFTAGTYNFSVTADDGVRLYIDNVLVIDKWIDQGATTYTAERTLTAGTHDIKMEYYENGGGAVAKFSYTTVAAPAPPPPPASGITSGNTYKLVNPNSSKALDVNGGGTANGTGVQIWTDDGRAGQKWQIIQNADGTYKLVNPNSAKALDVNGGGTTDGTNVQIWTDSSNNAAQKWSITRNADGTYKLINLGSGKALDVNGAGTANGTKVHIWTDNGSAAQKWSITEVSATTTPPPPPPPPQTGTELLTASWNLVGNNGASEKYQSIAPNALTGKTTLRVTYDLHGLSAMGGDASAIIFDQNGWKFVSLSNYGQNGLNGSQTVDIPLNAFGLNLSQSVGTLHTRFWYSGPFTVDITSIKVL